MKFLVIGDVVGKSGMNRIKEELPRTIQQEKIDFCIVNGENSANGKGLRIQEYHEILSYGADVITMGNHIYYRKEMAEEYSKLPRLLIPANVTNLNGHKHLVIEKNDKKIGVIQILGSVDMGEIFMHHTTSPFQTILEQIAAVKEEGADYIFVDFHAEVTAEKIAMGYFLADKVNCMFGTHTHVQTADETILETGMAYITDIGMTGPKDSVLGLKKEIAIQRFTTGQYLKYECSNNKACYCGIIVEIEDETKKAKSIQRINE